jgi:hypothetical protein
LGGGGFAAGGRGGGGRAATGCGGGVGGRAATGCGGGLTTAALGGGGFTTAVLGGTTVARGFGGVFVGLSGVPPLVAGRMVPIGRFFSSAAAPAGAAPGCVVLDFISLAGATPLPAFAGTTPLPSNWPGLEVAAIAGLP